MIHVLTLIGGETLEVPSTGDRSRLFGLFLKRLGSREVVASKHSRHAQVSSSFSHPPSLRCPARAPLPTWSSATPAEPRGRRCRSDDCRAGARPADEDVAAPAAARRSVWCDDACLTDIRSFVRRPFQMRRRFAREAGVITRYWSASATKSSSRSRIASRTVRNACNRCSSVPVAALGSSKLQ